MIRKMLCVKALKWKKEREIGALRVERMKVKLIYYQNALSPLLHVLSKITCLDSKKVTIKTPWNFKTKLVVVYV